MPRRFEAVLIVSLLALLPAIARCQDKFDEAPVEIEKDASFARWPFLADVTAPNVVAPGTKFGSADIPAWVLGKALPDLADVRLADGAGQRVPYALRVLRDVSRQTPIRVERRFDAGPIVKDKAYEESFELAQVPLPGHNEIEIQTAGDDFRRRIQVFGSNTPDFANAQALLPPKTDLVRFQTQGRVVVTNRFPYAHKLFRFLKVRIEADRYNGEPIPTIESVTVFQAETTAGKYVTYPVRFSASHGVRGQGGPATAYTLDLGDEPIFCEKLTLKVRERANAERPFRLQIANRGQVHQEIAGVEWRWRMDGDQQFVELTFPEIRAQNLRLVVTDFDNPPFSFVEGTGTMAVRQITFAWPDAKANFPVTLYFGNLQAAPPRYDLDRQLPIAFDPLPAVCDIGPRRDNPTYSPPPLAFNERNPWAVYVVLTLATLVLAGLLVPLAREMVVKKGTVG